MCTDHRARLDVSKDPREEFAPSTHGWTAMQSTTRTATWRRAAWPIPGVESLRCGLGADGRDRTDRRGPSCPAA